MLVGLGSGTTSERMIRKLAEKVHNGLSILAVASSEKSANLAQDLGIQLTTMAKVRKLDVYIDGADEFDSKLQLIKGGGGALLREKILAHNSKCNIIIADSSKQVMRLGNFRLPIETIPFATESIIAKLAELKLGPVLRKEKGVAFLTDEQNYIVDINIVEIDDIEAFNQFLIQIPGIVETGLFIGYTDILIVGKGDSTLIFKKDMK